MKNGPRLPRKITTAGIQSIDLGKCPDLDRKRACQKRKMGAFMLLINSLVQIRIRNDKIDNQTIFSFSCGAIKTLIKIINTITTTTTFPVALGLGPAKSVNAYITT